MSHQNHLHCTHFSQFIKNSLLHIVMDEKRRRYPRIIIKTYLYLSPDEQFRWMYIYPSWTKSKNIHWSIIVSRKVISTPTESRFFKIQKKRNRYNECSFKYFWTEGSRNGIAFLCIFMTNVIFYYFICCMEKWRFVDYLFMSIQINFPSRFEKFSFSALCTSFRVIFFDSYPVVMGPQTVLLFVGTPELMSVLAHVSHF